MIGRSQTERAALLNSSAFFTAVEVQSASCEEPIGESIKVVAWNAKYCDYIEESAKLLAGLEADVLLLSEMGHGMARSGQEHTTARLAEKLNCGYVYGAEYLSGNPAKYVGCRGNAILSRAGFKRSGLIRLSVLESERNVGGRLAVVTTIDIGGQEVVFRFSAS